MTIMFCQHCHSMAECRVESPQPSIRTVYFEQPYINAYVRTRTCSSCRKPFTTYEIGEKTFMTLRKVVELAHSAGQVIDETWSTTRALFFGQKATRSAGSAGAPLPLPNDEKLESLLPPNVILFKPRNPGGAKDDPEG